MTWSSSVADVSRWLPVGLIVAVLLVLQFIGPEHLRYETAAIRNLELWRVLSGHWVHANWAHFFMNMAGFALCMALTGVRWKLAGWTLRILALSAAISACFYLFNPGLGWYVGYSGVLFGLYVLAAVDSMPSQPWMSAVILLFVLVKVALEQGASVNITTSELIGVPVLVDAHLYGVLAALSLIALQHLSKRFANFSK